MTHFDDYELRKLLEHGNRKERCDVAVALGDAGKDYPMTLGALARAVWQDESRAVRRAAAESLYRLGDAGFEMLRQMLIDDSVKMRLMAESFSRLGGAYYDHFYELEERDERARESIIEALGNFKDKRAVRAMIDVIEKEDAVGRGKTQEEWSSSHDLDWWYVSEHLGRIADADIDALLDVLENGCGHMRICVADALGAVENADERVISALIKALKSDKKNDLLSIIAQNAAESLGKLGDRRAVSALIECVNRGCVSVEAARALGKIGDESAVPALIKALPHESAAYALGRIGDESAIPALKEVLNQEIEWMIEAAEADDYYTPNWESARALCEFGDAGLDAIVNVVRPHVRDRGRFDAFVKIVKTASFEPEDGAYFCETDGVFGREITPILMYIIKNIDIDSEFVFDNLEFEGATCFANLMYALNDQEFGIILDLIGDDDVRMRRAAVEVGQQPLADHFGIDYLDVDPCDADGDVPYQMVDALKDDDEFVRHSVAGMFGCLDGLDTDVAYTIDSLTYMLEDPDPNIRDGATRALYNLGRGFSGWIYEWFCDQIVKSLLEVSDDEVVFAALVDKMWDYNFDFWYSDKPEITNPIIMKALLKDRNIALLGDHSSSVITDPLKELHSEIWNTIMQALYDKNWYAIGTFGSFMRWFPPIIYHNDSTIGELIKKLNNKNAEAIDREIAAVVLGALYSESSWQIDDIKRKSNIVLSALTKCMSDLGISQELRDYVASVVTKEPTPPFDYSKDLRTLFREYHESRRSEPNERQ